MSSYNTTCKKCGKPAYQGLGPVKCSNGYCEDAEEPTDCTRCRRPDCHPALFPVKGKLVCYQCLTPAEQAVADKEVQDLKWNSKITKAVDLMAPTLDTIVDDPKVQAFRKFIDDYIDRLKASGWKVRGSSQGFDPHLGLR